MSNLKLGVEVASAHDLTAKDGPNGTCAFVEVEFDNQRCRTAVKERDVNPHWNETFYFTVSNPAALSQLHLEARVYHLSRRATNARTLLGKTRISGTSFVGAGDAATLYYPLEKGVIFSRGRGELGLKVFYTDDPSVTATVPAADFDTVLSSAASVLGVQNDNNLVGPTTPARRKLHSVGKQDDPRERPYSFVSGVESTRMATASGLKVETPPSGIARIFSWSSAQQPVDFQLKETSPSLGSGRGGKAGTYDLVENMQYLFVRVEKARDLPHLDITGKLDPYVEVRLGNYKMKTKHFEKNQNPEWDHVFAFPRERVQSSFLEVVVKDKDTLRDDVAGKVFFDLNEIPTRVPPDSPLAPEWYRLEDNQRAKVRGEIMLAVWYGTQADECFPYATHADGAVLADPAMGHHIRGKVYPSPRLWYVRVNVIEAHDIFVSDKSRIPQVLVLVRVGSQVLRTRTVQLPTSTAANFLWNEEFMFVAAEPFDDELVVTVEDRVSHNKDEIIGKIHIPLGSLDRRSDDRFLPSRWYDLRQPALIDPNLMKEDKFSAKIHLRLCLEGGYHVLDESTHYSSDLRPTMKQLWKQPIGVLELGILNADGLPPTKTRDGQGSCDAYCVAKYGQKWIRTRTVVDSRSPRFNEQYTWEVYDHGTVITVGVFHNSRLDEKDGDNSNGHKDTPIGKVRIRLSTLELGRVYTHSYPLIQLHHSGVKKMGELHLAIRFSPTSLLNVFHMYTRPLLPKMHYVRPLSIVQQEMLRHQAVQIVAQRLSRMEPPVRKEVVDFMSDATAHLWSMRRSKANFFRLLNVFSPLISAFKWFSEVCVWKNPVTTVLVHVLFVMLVSFPDLILPTVCLYMFLIGLWNYRLRPRYPPHMNTRLSHADAVSQDELDEEFDRFPTSRHPDLVKNRYDRLRHIAGRIQTVVGDVATQGERLQSLLSWRDPRATGMFLLFCLIAAVILYVTPVKVLVVAGGFHQMRHPRFRHKLPPVAINFFRRLPARTDSLL